MILKLLFALIAIFTVLEKLYKFKIFAYNKYGKPFIDWLEKTNRPDIPRLWNQHHLATSGILASISLIGIFHFYNQQHLFDVIFGYAYISLSIIGLVLNAIIWKRKKFFFESKFKIEHF